MSMNLYIVGTRQVIVKDHPEIESSEHIHFNQLQTPTHITYKILDLKNVDEQITTYKKWIDEVYSNHKRAAKEHKRELDKFVKQCKEGYYTIEMYTV